MKTSPFSLLSVLVLTSVAQSAIVLQDDFESPNISANSYTVANTSGQASSQWVRATTGFNASRNGTVYESRTGEAFTDPVGSQAYAFRYSSNTGLTTAFAEVGTLAVGQTITVSFDVLQDNFNGNNYSNYNVGLVLFNGASTRNAVQNFQNNTVGILDIANGTATSNTVWTNVSFSYTVGDSVVDNNGAGAGANTAWDNGLLGYDIALRFGGQGYGALVDNVVIDISSIPEPTSAVLMGLGGLLLLRRRRA